MTEEIHEEVFVGGDEVKDDSPLENVGVAIEQPAINPLAQKQIELEEQYKNVCTREVLYAEKLKNIQEQRKALADQLELVRSMAA